MRATYHFAAKIGGIQEVQTGTWYDSQLTPEEALEDAWTEFTYAYDREPDALWITSIERSR